MLINVNKNMLIKIWGNKHTHILLGGSTNYCNLFGKKNMDHSSNSKY